MNDAQRILLVDDDPRLVRLLAQYLGREGYRVATAANGREMREQMADSQPDLVLLDLGLPGEDGLALTREIRVRSAIPIIILTGKAHTVDKVVGLELGADDYVTKPFDERELLARVRSVLRRAQAGGEASAPALGRVAQFCGWQLDLTAQELTSPEGERVHLTSHEYQLLEAFVTRPHRVLSRDTLMDLVAGRDWSPMDRSIDVLIAKLRKKIERTPEQPSLIKTIRGAGYKFTGQVSFG
jgi:two-component system phosphate regulon response regulator OmpR